MYIITAKRVTSGDVRKLRNGLRLAINRRDATALPRSSAIALTIPIRDNLNLLRSYKTAQICLKRYVPAA